MTYFERKYEYFRQFIDKVDIAQENPNDWQGWSTWNRFFAIGQIKQSNIHRSLLPNEWVMDIDANDPESALDYLKRLLVMLDDYQIPRHVWSSGRYYHVHVFYDFSKLTFSDSQIEKLKTITYLYFVRTNTKPTSENKEKLGELISRNIPLTFAAALDTENAWIDRQKFNVRRFLIRAEGSKNTKTGYFKTLLTEDLLFKAKTEEAVVYPEILTSWTPDSKAFFNLYVRTYERVIRPNIKSNMLKMRTFVRYQSYEKREVQ